MNGVWLVFVGHGSRQKISTIEFISLIDQFKSRFPRVQCSYCFVELEKPSLLEHLQEIADKKEVNKLVLIPIFLFSSRHVKNDLPLALSKLKQTHPHKEFICAETIKSNRTIIDLIIGQINKRVDHCKNATLLMVGRGASDPDSNSEFCKLTRLIEEKADFKNSSVAFVGITRPLLKDQLNLISRQRPSSLVIVPYFLFKGRLLYRLIDDVDAFKVKYPWVKTFLTEHIGANSNLVDYLYGRYLQSTGPEPLEPLPCINCHYRSDLEHISKNVKGTESLLWSVRHLYTHSQAKPHEYPHRALKKHVLVCESVDCAKKGSKEITTHLRRLIKEGDRGQTMRVTKTHCMGRCGEGPCVAVYPDGVWYRNVLQEDAKEIYEKHLLKDQIVEHIVDDILV